MEGGCHCGRVRFRITADLDGVTICNCSICTMKGIWHLIVGSFGGGPVGIETIAAALSEPRDAIEDIIEPYLIQKGFVQRTPRGRVLTPHAFRHLGIPEPSRETAAQFGLFNGDGDE